MAAGGTANGYKNFNAGLGFLLTYDSRDIPANAYKGIYLDFRGMMYSKASAVTTTSTVWNWTTASTSP